LDEGHGDNVHERMFETVTKIVLRRARGAVNGHYETPHPMRWYDAERIYERH
jgi:hypothetical protein